MNGMVYWKCNPTPTTTTTPAAPSVLNILQFNCDGLRSRLPEINHFMEQYNIFETDLALAAIQLSAHRVEDKEDDIAVIMHNDIKYQQQPITIRYV